MYMHCHISHVSINTLYIPVQYNNNKIFIVNQGPIARLSPAEKSQINYDIEIIDLITVIYI